MKIHIPRRSISIPYCPKGLLLTQKIIGLKIEADPDLYDWGISKRISYPANGTQCRCLKITTKKDFYLSELFVKTLEICPAPFLTQEQVMEYCKKYSSMLSKRLSTLFFIEEINEVFVVCIDVSTGSIVLTIFKLNQVYKWDASKFSLIVPI